MMNRPVVKAELVEWMRSSQTQVTGELAEVLNFAKENKKPIKAIARNNSKEFFLKQGFKDVETKNPEGHDILIWNP